ncbi:MAG: penicillin-binding protein, partial [Pseudomonadota bacterium]
AGVVFTEFMQRALEDEPALPFRMPPGVRLVEVDRITGRLPTIQSDEVILEAFRPGTEPGLFFADANGLAVSGTGGDIIFGNDDSGSIFSTSPLGDDVEGLDSFERPETPVEEDLDDIY